MSTTVNSAAPVSAPVAREKMQRAIPMTFYRDGRGSFANGKSRELKDDIVSLSAKMNEAGEDGDLATIRVGLLIGQVIGSKQSTRAEKDGTTRLTTLLLGSFKATRFSDGATMKASGAYLPSLFVDHAIAAMAASGGQGVEFAIELGVERDNRPAAIMPYTWTVTNLLPNAPGVIDPLDRIAAMVGGHDLVQLPMATVSSKALGHDPETGEIAPDVGEGASAEDKASKAKAKRAA